MSKSYAEVSIHMVHTCAPEVFPVTIEPVESHTHMPSYYRVNMAGVFEPVESHMPSYYRVNMAGVYMVITDAHRQQIIKALTDAPPLPKSDAQIDAEREDTGYAPTMGDTEVFRG